MSRIKAIIRSTVQQLIFPKLYFLISYSIFNTNSHEIYSKLLYSSISPFIEFGEKRSVTIRSLLNYPHSMPRVQYFQILQNLSYQIHENHIGNFHTLLNYSHLRWSIKKHL